MPFRDTCRPIFIESCSRRTVRYRFPLLDESTLFHNRIFASQQAGRWNVFDLDGLDVNEYAFFEKGAVIGDRHF